MMTYNKRVSILVKFLLGSVVTYVGSVLVFSVLLGALSTLGFALAFAVPLVILVFALAALPVVGTVFAGIQNETKVPYAVGAIAAVLIQISVPIFKAHSIENVIAERQTYQRMKQLTQQVKSIILDCDNCYGMDISLPVLLSKRVYVFRNMKHRQLFELVKIPAIQCDDTKASTWNERYLRAGYSDWCIVEQPVTETLDALIFRFNVYSKISPMRNFSGWQIEVVEMVRGIERPVSYWEVGTVWVEATPPFGFPRNVQVGTKDTQPTVVFNHVLGLVEPASLPINPNRNIQNDVLLALRLLKSIGSRYVGYTALNNLRTILSDSQKREVERALNDRIANGAEREELTFITPLLESYRQK